MDLAALKSEIVNDPQHVGYASALTIRDDVAIAGLLNDPTKGGTITLAWVDKSAVAQLIAPAYSILAGKDAGAQYVWGNIFNLTMQLDGINPSNPVVTAQLAAVVAAGLLTQDQINAVTQRAGSRAEKLWGAGTVVGVDQVGQALNLE